MGLGRGFGGFLFPFFPWWLLNKPQRCFTQASGNLTFVSISSSSFEHGAVQLIWLLIPPHP